ncbi:MAG: hypothetical protein ACREBU_09610 [Nitrososphaera sp.]
MERRGAGQAAVGQSRHAISWAYTPGTPKLVNAVARKHFRSMNIDYRPISPDFAEWWKPEENNAVRISNSM